MNVAAVAATVTSHDSIPTSTAYESLTHQDDTVANSALTRTMELLAPDLHSKDIDFTDSRQNPDVLLSSPPPPVSSSQVIIKNPTNTCTVDSSVIKENGTSIIKIESTPSKESNNDCFISSIEMKCDVDLTLPDHNKGTPSKSLEKLLSSGCFSPTKDKVPTEYSLISNSYNGLCDPSKTVFSSPNKPISYPSPMQNGMYFTNISDNHAMMPPSNCPSLSHHPPNISSQAHLPPSSIPYHHPINSSQSSIPSQQQQHHHLQQQQHQQHALSRQQQQPLLSVSSMPSSSAISYVNSVGAINHQTYAPSPILLTSLPASANTRCFTVLRPTFLVGGPGAPNAPGGYFIATAPGGQINAAPTGYTVVAQQQPHKNGLNQQSCAYGVTNPTPCLGGYPILVNKPPTTIVVSPEKNNIAGGGGGTLQTSTTLGTMSTSPMKVLMPTSKVSKNKKKEPTSSYNNNDDFNDNQAVSKPPPSKRSRKKPTPSLQSSNTSAIAKTISSVIGEFNATNNVTNTVNINNNSNSSNNNNNNNTNSNNNQLVSATDILTILKSRFTPTFSPKPQLPTFRPLHFPIMPSENILSADADSELKLLQSIPRHCHGKYSMFNILLRHVNKEKNGIITTNCGGESIDNSTTTTTTTAFSSSHLQIKSEDIKTEPNDDSHTFRRPLSPCRPGLLLVLQNQRLLSSLLSSSSTYDTEVAYSFKHLIQNKTLHCDKIVHPLTLCRKCGKEIINNDTKFSTFSSPSTSDSSSTTTLSSTPILTTSPWRTRLGAEVLVAEHPSLCKQMSTSCQTKKLSVPESEDLQQQQPPPPSTTESQPLIPPLTPSSSQPPPPPLQPATTSDSIVQYAFCSADCNRSFLQQLDRIHSRTMLSSSYFTTSEDGDVTYDENELQSLLTGTKVNCFLSYHLSKWRYQQKQQLPLFFVHLGSVPRLLLQTGSTSSLLLFPWKRKHNNSSNSTSIFTANNNNVIAAKKRKLNNDQRIRWQNIRWKYNHHHHHLNNKTSNNYHHHHHQQQQQQQLPQQQLNIKSTTPFDCVSSDEIDLRHQTASIVLNDNRYNDQRICSLCSRKGDLSENSAGRLLCFDIDRWLHVNCVLWCLNVYETQGGALSTVINNYNQAKKRRCTRCNQFGAGVPCYSHHCNLFYHLPCAREANCQFTSDRGMFCPKHLLTDKELLSLSSSSSSTTTTIGTTTTKSNALNYYNFTILDDLSVQRRVYIDRSEKEQIAQVVIEDELQHVIRIGSWVLLSPGQLLPHHITTGNFHSRDYVYPVGYLVRRYYWSLFKPNSRAVYECSISEDISDVIPKPLFRIKVVHDPFCQNNNETSTTDATDNTTDANTDNTTEMEDTIMEFEDHSPSLVWLKVLQKISLLRSAARKIHLFSQHLFGEKLFGLCEPHIVRIVESLSGVEMLRDYAFKFGRMELISNMPLAVNPRGCARAEPKRDKFVSRLSNNNHHHTTNTTTTFTTNTTNNTCGDSGTSTSSSSSRVHHFNAVLSQRNYHYHSDSLSSIQQDNNQNTSSNQNLLSPSELANYYGSDDFTTGNNVTTGAGGTGGGNAKSCQGNNTNNKHRQYRRLQKEYSDNVVLRRSGIQGLGLYAARNIEKGTMIIEYIGELIRNEVANRREKLYEDHNRGIYMFRMNDDWIVDATMTGGLARYINHSCNPNCVAEIVSLDCEQQHIIIMANRDIVNGEELTYDYKFDIEDSSQGLPCLCGAPNCRKWMNG